MPSQELIVYEDPQQFSLILGSGASCGFILPGVALSDEKLIALWLHDKSEKTARAYTRDLGQFYAEIGKPLCEVTLGDLQRFNNSLFRLKTASRARMLATIKSILTFGAKLNMLPTNVGAVYKLPRPEDTLAERIMSEHSVDEILQGEKDVRNHAILVLLYYGGLRVSEICNLKWRNLQERDTTGQISVFGKGDKTRHILLDTDTWREVWTLRGKARLDDYVFQSRQSRSRKGEKGRRMDESRVGQIVHEAAARVGVAIDEDFKSNVSPHWFRHSHATHAIEAGAPITLVRDTLGHSSIETTAKYAHVRPNDSSAFILRKRRQKEK